MAEGLKRITDHAVLVCQPGVKRAGFAHAGTWWTTFHATTETDIDKLKRELTDEYELLQTWHSELTAQVRDILPCRHKPERVRLKRYS